MANEIEKVYNFERDVATAKAVNPNFDKVASNIAGYSRNFRSTYADQEYLRDPVGPMEHAQRQNDDKAKRDFEAYKQALDNTKLAYQVEQSNKVATDAATGAPA